MNYITWLQIIQFVFIMEFRSKVIVCLTFLIEINAETCPKQCDCDMENGYKRAACDNQNIVTIDIGVPSSVQIYNLRHNAINELENYCFKEIGYKSIVDLNLSNNLIFWIGLHAFAGLEYLKHLDLSNNRLRFIPSDLFWETPTLELLDLSGNVFESLKNEPFLMHAVLKVLNLSNCRMKSIPERMFTRLSSLAKLDLSENYMISLKIDVLVPLHKLERLELHNDYWQCNADFLRLENWITNQNIAYHKQCKKLMPKMSEKLLSAVTANIREDININKVWNITETELDTKANISKVPDKTMTLLERFNQDFPALQALLMGLEIGFVVGVMGTYIWLRSLCKCSHLNCKRPQTRRQRVRAQRCVDNELRDNLLWNTSIQPDVETPPQFRRQLSLPDRSPPLPTYGLPSISEASQSIHFADMVSRAETPPPPYESRNIVSLY